MLITKLRRIQSMVEANADPEQAMKKQVTDAGVQMAKIVDDIIRTTEMALKDLKETKAMEGW
jgi:hypothetical protein